MKKVVTVGVLAALTMGALLLTRDRNEEEGSSTQSTQPGDSGTTDSDSGLSNGGSGVGRSTKQGDSASLESGAVEDGVGLDQPDRSATEIYRSAEDALAAVKDGASRYDDVILEQFESPPVECSWCASFYDSIRSLAFSADTPSDQKSYFAELLSISARPENLEALIDGIEKAPNEESARQYAEALEMASASKDDLVKLLGSKLGTQNEVLKESLIAAVTIQGTPLAIETLYKYTIESNDPDGFYSKGTGLGEAVAEPESFPFLKEIAEKRDQYSHLGIKALLNSGAEGVRVVFDVLRASKNPEGDKQLLRDALEHVNFEEETEALITNEAKNGTNPLSVNFAREVLKNFEQENAQIQQEALEVEGGMSSAEE
jgi:hypothetical protein